MSKQKTNSNRLILSFAMIFLLAALLFYFQGSSQTEDIAEKEPIPEFDTTSGRPFTSPKKLGEGEIPSFPLPNGSIPNLPTIPGDVLPEVSGNGEDWGYSQIDNPDQNPSLTIPSTPDFSFPTEFPSGINTLPTFSQSPVFTRPSITGGPNFPNTNNSSPNNDSFSFPSFNFSKMPARSRYMPQFNLSSFLQIDLKFGIFDITFLISIRQTMFFLAIAFLYFTSGYLVDKLSNLDEDRFIRKKVQEENKLDDNRKQEQEKELKRKRERIRRLINFRDHLFVISQWVKSNIDNSNPSELVIQTYHKLDEAFSNFSRLKREVGETPLEHANKHFETGELDNEVLGKLVQLFYMARYGKKELTKTETGLLVYLLEHLVPETVDIEEEQTNE